MAGDERLLALWEDVEDPDPLVRGRAVDALEKASRTEPGVLEGHERQVLEELPSSELAQVRWHVGQLIPRLDLAEEQVRLAAVVLGRLLEDRSRITQATALDGLVSLADQHPELADQAAQALTRGLVSPYPSVRARARRLLR
jgi:hypothetical protein